LPLRRVVGLNLFTLIGALLLLVGASLVGVLQFERDYRDQAFCAGWMILPISFAYLLLGLRIIAVNNEFIQANPGTSRKHIALGILAPMCLSILLCASAPAIYMAAERRAMIRSVRQETPLKRAVADVCAHLFRDPKYILQIPQGVAGSYYRVGGNDHVFIRRDATGEAYWFDVADSLGSGGYVCIRPGSAVEEAISNYDFWTTKRDLIHMFENLFWWN
jgi:hypothetical protein